MSDLERLRDSLAMYARALEVEHPILRGPAHGPNGAERRNPFSECHECALLNDFTNGRLPVAAPSSDAASQPETLDVAWKEAEAALPEGESIGVTSTVGVTAGRYVATTSYGPPGRGFVYADSPAAALRNRAARLQEGKE